MGWINIRIEKELDDLFTYLSDRMEIPKAVYVKKLLLENLKEKILPVLLKDYEQGKIGLKKIIKLTGIDPSELLEIISKSGEEHSGEKFVAGEVRAVNPSETRGIFRGLFPGRELVPVPQEHTKIRGRPHQINGRAQHHLDAHQSSRFCNTWVHNFFASSTPTTNDSNNRLGSMRSGVSWTEWTMLLAPPLAIVKLS